jgi:hypothetical protein
MMRFVEVLAQVPGLYQNRKNNERGFTLFSSGLEAERSVMYNQNKPAREHHDE